MSFVTVLSRAQIGLQAPLVRVEAHIGGGLPRFAIVGLAETAVKESRDRVRAAIRNSGLEFPQGRIIVNLAPADVPKEGGRFDLPIALGILAASRQLSVSQETWHQYEFYGELGLSGSIRGFRGALPVTLAARADRRTLLVPFDNLDEVNVVTGGRVLAAEHLNTVIAHLSGTRKLPLEKTAVTDSCTESLPDLSDVRGQYYARRALEIAASGGHSLLMIGPPGTGKSMLATRLPGILPEMSAGEALETAAIHSLSTTGFFRQNWRVRPFRSPHHTASAVALVGGGSNPRPGEISLAHHGVLFLDELPEFQRQVLEVLRQPMESGTIVISRAARQAEFPCRFQLVAAMNPCPCGHLGDPDVLCRCGVTQVQRYRDRVSAPLLDRIDLQVAVTRVPRELLRLEAPPGESSEQVRLRVRQARKLQVARGAACNAMLSEPDLREFCMLDKKGSALIEQAMKKLSFSARAYKRILRVARTIADLADAPTITAENVAEAISFRELNRRQPVDKTPLRQSAGTTL